MPRRPAEVDEDGLTELERRFVEHYMGKARGNKSEAYRLAAWPNKITRKSSYQMGSIMANRPAVRAALKQAQEDDPLVATRVERLRFLTAVMRAKVRNQKLMSTGEKASLRPDVRDRVAACEALSKALGDYLPRKDDGEDMSSWTVAELLAMLKGGA